MEAAKNLARSDLIEYALNIDIVYDMSYDELFYRVCKKLLELEKEIEDVRNLVNK